MKRHRRSSLKIEYPVNVSGLVEEQKALKVKVAVLETDVKAIKEKKEIKVNG